MQPITVYLSGEIHSSWRDEIVSHARKRTLPIRFIAPELDHPTSDDIGAKILGSEESTFWHDHKAAKINALRTGHALRRADFVVVRFGDKFKQWNAAFEAGLANASGTPFITLHSPSLDHALKEVDAAAHAVARNIEQVVSILEYATLSSAEQ